MPYKQGMDQFAPAGESEERSAAEAIPAAPAALHAPLSERAFVVLLAALMAVNALAVDIMLPGFPDIALSMGGIEVTRVQAIITLYMFGFGLSQVFIGFLADKYGRRPVLLAGLGIYAVAAFVAAMAGSFETLLAARFMQGIGSGAPRVVAVAAARDCYGGRRMARIMSFVMTIFIVVPVLAPSIGQGILLVANWHAVMLFLAAYSALIIAICWFRFPETLPPEKRRDISWPLIREAFGSIFLNRQTVGYMLAAGTFFGSLFGFIGTVQPLMVDVYGLGLWFPIAFAGMALAMGCSTLINGHIVERFGMRLLSHSGALASTVVSLTMLAFAQAGQLDFITFVCLMSVNLLLVGLVFSNFNAIAMEPQGHVAGVASAFVSAATVIVGASIGYFIGASFDNSPVPLVTGFAACGLATLCIVAVTERGRLFRGHNPGRR